MRVVRSDDGAVLAEVSVAAPLEGRIYLAWEHLTYEPPVGPTGVYLFVP